MLAPLREAGSAVGCCIRCKAFPRPLPDPAAGAGRLLRGGRRPGGAGAGPPPGRGLGRRRGRGAGRGAPALPLRRHAGGRRGGDPARRWPRTCARGSACREAAVRGYLRALPRGALAAGDRDRRDPAAALTGPAARGDREPSPGQLAGPARPLAPDSSPLVVAPRPRDPAPARRTGSGEPTASRRFAERYSSFAQRAELLDLLGIGCYAH